MPGDTTLRPVRAPQPARAAASWLTVIWHPDPSRIGDSAKVADRMRLSRLEPEFGRVPLEDRHVSRQPIVFDVTADHVELTPLAEVELAVAGRPVTSRYRIDRETLARGVAIALADRVVLWLQHREEPIAQDRELVGISTAISRLRKQVTGLAATRHPVLILGETGAGKERVARAIHSEGPFVAVNMATVTPATAPAQLFGHVRGAFTGADRAAPGLFGRADGGTLFLDEVFETPPETQAMLLRVLDDGELLPVGGEPRKVNVRVVAATDGDPSSPAFRSQLYHRLAAHTIAVPPLRAHPEDIGPLLAQFIAAEPITRELTAVQLGAWMAEPWPGNVRELRNAFRQWARSEADEPPPEPRPAELDDARIEAALAAADWAPGAAASALGIAKTTLYAWIERSDRVRKARDLDANEIRDALANHDQDAERAARALRVSQRGLRLRMRELELS